MVKSIIILILLTNASLGQDCIRYGEPTSLAGTLFIKDEAGYNQFIALKLDRPICTATDPKNMSNPGLQHERPHSDVQVMQAGVFGSDATANALRKQLDRLVGQKATIKGFLFHAHVGYHRTSVQLWVEAVDPVDEAGRLSLQLKEPEFKAKDVSAYDVTVHAGQRLVIEAREAGSGTPLLPSDQYFSHYMTAGEIVYLKCREGYERHLISSSEKDDELCINDEFCFISAFPSKPIILKFRCTKKFSNQRTTGK